MRIREAWQAWVARLQDYQRARARRNQRMSVETQLMYVCVRLDEARRYVERDRETERRERDRLIMQRQAARDRLTEVEHLLRTYIMTQQILDAEAAKGAARRAREVLASDFSLLDET